MRETGILEYLADRKALVLALLLFPISLQWETTTKQARMLSANYSRILRAFDGWIILLGIACHKFST